MTGTSDCYGSEKGGLLHANGSADGVLKFPSISSSFLRRASGNVVAAAVDPPPVPVFMRNVRPPAVAPLRMRTPEDSQSSAPYAGQTVLCLGSRTQRETGRCWSDSVAGSTVGTSALKLLSCSGRKHFVLSEINCNLPRLRIRTCHPLRLHSSHLLSSFSCASACYATTTTTR